MSVTKAAGWSIFSSLPQPLMAIPAYLFVSTFKPMLPFGLGLAAGAMIWMVFAELLPDANKKLEPASGSLTAPLILQRAALASFTALCDWTTAADFRL